MSNRSIWFIDRSLSGPTAPSQSGPGSDGNKEVLRIPQHHWNLTIRLFSVISRTLVEGVLPLCKGAVDVFNCSIQLGNLSFWVAPKSAMDKLDACCCRYEIYHWALKAKQLNLHQVCVRYTTPFYHQQRLVQLQCSMFGHLLQMP